MADQRDIALALAPIGNYVADIGDALKVFALTLPENFQNSSEFAAFAEKMLAGLNGINSAATLAGRMAGAKV